MVQRITSASRYDLLLTDMRRNMANYNKALEQLSSSSKINHLTDDPIGAVNVLNTNRQLGQIETFETNVGMASAELAALGDLMELASGYLSQAWDKAIQANNQTYNENSLKALKVEIDEITKTMVDLANTEYNDNYIFAGANTKTIPYEIAENGDIVYYGTPNSNPDYIRQTEVADGVFEIINTTGDKVFGYYKSAVEPGNGVYTDADGQRVYESTDADGNTVYKYENGAEYTGDVADLTDGAAEEYDGVMGALRVLSNSIQAALDAPTDVDRTEAFNTMRSTLDMFSDSLNTITNEQTKFGGVANRLEMTESTLGTSSDSLTNYLSNINSVDYAEAVTNWLNAQYAYQASLQVTASSMNLSLLNYM
ncbi:MAG: flagellar hook-associated protein FlgL [Candidatus Gastranaerophilales bacterium]|nr:flagellar hook-associated protein FlgL [Candidatus Gastranaerophilales bacterium]MCM1073195.1 flagellar hook-associated protein FlgL [Bacteroides sp.]